ncbi:hypothetical protein QFC21_004178 [Naganishia friedmannii]|uniref:Uncharacterized protein n=2 Tax=Naganishia TaxID=1851509 RepID=A0ACC2VK57_9TREE|nr:hypothetical protein QFC21_004178 [Naganishia friedmannii]
MSFLARRLARSQVTRTFSTSVRRLGGGGVGEGQAAPTYVHKFLKEPPTVAVVGCPFSGGQARPGVDLGPNALVEFGLLNQIKQLGWNVSYDGAKPFADIAHTRHDADDAVDPPSHNMKNARLVSAVCERLAEVVGQHAKRGELPVTVGGDHSLALGSIAGTMSKHPDACVLWIDAHADINTPLTTTTGNLHGCPVSFLLGLDGTDVAPFNKWAKPCLSPNRIVYIGLRDVDPAEKRILRENNIKCFTMHDVDKYGIGACVQKALDHVNPERTRPVHLSFDVDATDPSVAGSTGTPVRGGLTFREGHYICEAVAETGCLVALDIMEVNPTLGDEKLVEQTVAVGCSLARAALGETLL